MPALRINRPLRRYPARLWCLLRHGRAGSHAADWWPGLVLRKPTSGEAGAIFFRDRAVAPLLPFPETASRPDELVVVGSGPSLAGQARERIPVRSALLLNGAIHLLEETAPRPFGVVVEDERFVWRHWPALRQKVPPGTDCWFSTSVMRALCEIAPGWLAERNIRHLDFVHRPYGAKRRDHAALVALPFLRWSRDGKAAISLSPARGLVLAGSVAVTAAQLALSLAPSRIGFAGIDLTNTHRPRFYEKEGETAMSRLEAAEEKILAAFRLIREEAEGIVVENYSPVSALAKCDIPYVPRLEP